VQQHELRTVAIGAVSAALILGACGPVGTNVASHSPAPAASGSASPNASGAPTPSPISSADLRLVIWDVAANQVRLARADATDTATVAGQYDEVVAGQVIVLNGNLVESLNSAGTVAKLGVRATPASGWYLDDTVAVAPDLSQWAYSIRDDSSTAQVHLGTASGDRVVATLASPNGNGNAYYRPYVWNHSGLYMVRQAVGIGGAGPFLEYEFPLARFDLNTGKVSDVTPLCVAYGVLDDGTLLCGNRTQGGIEVRSPSGKVNAIHIATGTGTDANAAFVRVMPSADQKSLIAGRNGNPNPSLINYQMARTSLTGSAAQTFGPADYLPDAWLPDGRVVADHNCVDVSWHSGPCDSSKDGTYFISADGASASLFYKLTHGAVVGYV
jgi:hypothetical protein